MANPIATIMGQARHGPRLRLVWLALFPSLDLSHKRLTQCLVGIQTQDERLRRLGGRPVLLVCVGGEGPLKHPCTVGRGQLRRAI